MCACAVEEEEEEGEGEGSVCFVVSIECAGDGVLFFFSLFSLAMCVGNCVSHPGSTWLDSTALVLV